MGNQRDILVPAEKLEEQRAYTEAVRDALQRPLGYHIVTLGCQMNVHDSETIAGMLDEMGMTPVDTREEADLILYNTCCVRENAENKALGNVIWLKELKALKPSLIIAVGGCMMQEEGMGEKVRKMYPFIDLAFGTHNMYRLPELLFRVICEKQRAIEILDEDGGICEGLPVRRRNGFSAYINIMYGCNNFCSYCIVPYVRGRERSRSQEVIIEEAKALADSGVQEIMLLGQNVNSYMGGGAHFAELLYQIDRIGVPRVRFMTSHPKDISDELIACFGELKHLCRQLHLPVQAGNNRILQVMNRRYTREKYIETIGSIRRTCPDIGLTTDLIVGFPGETLAEFEETVSLVDEIRYDAAYTFIYSPRPGTRAASMPDDTPIEEKSRRIQRLIEHQQAVTTDICQRQIGRIEDVLVEEVSARDTSCVAGKTERGHMVNFRGDASLIGRIVPVKITSAGKNTLRGTLIEQSLTR
ncbi:MAG: tRNA (N6-isopentenyl adenosine(37)-C2)-methylthiotransferase MiaB [Clostridia bacterium]|nr:tRNA (N6-isopentenyl adenosine(37)-C2)-methylthiotransferase MiaB [Clostridia bacterium]